MKRHPLEVAVVGVTHRGSGRERNEDALLLGGWVSQTDIGTPTRLVLPRGGGLVAVADGLGGHPAGDRASLAALLALSRWSPASLDGARISAALAEASSAVRADAWRHDERRGMATTVAGLAFTPDDAVLAFNVGDSRCYRSTRAGLEQLSTDDARPRVDVHAGGRATSPTSPAVAPTRSSSTRPPTVLTQMIGGASSPTRAVDAHPSPSRAEPGARFLVCTDGLHGTVPDQILEAVLRADRSLEEVVERLQLLALQLGSTDDLTIAVAEVTGGP